MGTTGGHQGLLYEWEEEVSSEVGGVTCMVTMTLNMLMEFSQWNNRWPHDDQPKTLLSNCATMQKSLMTSHLTVSLVLDAHMTSSNTKTAQRHL